MSIGDKYDRSEAGIVVRGSRSTACCCGIQARPASDRSSTWILPPSGMRRVQAFSRCSSATTPAWSAPG
jgi:hypothetical protein